MMAIGFKGGLAIAITFPFNVTLGIPLYFALAGKLLAAN